MSRQPDKYSVGRGRYYFWTSDSENAEKYENKQKKKQQLLQRQKNRNKKRKGY